MPVASTVLGFVIYSTAMIVFVGQEFSQGFGGQQAAETRDDRWALVYLDGVPVVLVSIAIGFTFAGIVPLPTSPGLFASGIVVLLVGVAIRQWSHVTLGRFHRGVVTVHDDHELITSGPYRWVRHPMYAGSAVAFVGVGLSLGTWPGLLLTFFGTLPGMLRRIIVEERVLEDAMSQRYIAYAETRKRLIPGVW